MHASAFFFGCEAVDRSGEAMGGLVKSLRCSQIPRGLCPHWNMTAPLLLACSRIPPATQAKENLKIVTYTVAKKETSTKEIIVNHKGTRMDERRLTWIKNDEL